MGATMSGNCLDIVYLFLALTGIPFRKLSWEPTFANRTRKMGTRL